MLSASVKSTDLIRKFNKNKSNIRVYIVSYQGNEQKCLKVNMKNVQQRIYTKQ